MTPEQVETAKAWYRERLADPTLLERAVIPEGDGKDIAVPVGETRRAGCFNWPSLGVAEDEAIRNRIMPLLAAHPDLFPNLRWEYLGTPDLECLIRWGVDEKQIITKLQSAYNGVRDRSNFPMLLLLHLGRLYGFTETAVTKHINEHLQELIPPVFAGQQDEFLFSEFLLDGRNG